MGLTESFKMVFVGFGRRVWFLKIWIVPVSFIGLHGLGLKPFPSRLACLLMSSAGPISLFR